MSKQLGELQEHLGTREEISPSGHFSSKFDMGSYLLYEFSFFDKEFQKVSGEYEKQGQPIRIKVGT